jgi:hypothetical protein
MMGDVDCNAARIETPNGPILFVTMQSRINSSGMARYSNSHKISWKKDAGIGMFWQEGVVGASTFVDVHCNH